MPPPRGRRGRRRVVISRYAAPNSGAVPVAEAEDPKAKALSDAQAAQSKKGLATPPPAAGATTQEGEVVTFDEFVSKPQGWSDADKAKLCDRVREICPASPECAEGTADIPPLTPKWTTEDTVKAVGKFATDVFFNTKGKNGARPGGAAEGDCADIRKDLERISKSAKSVLKEAEGIVSFAKDRAAVAEAAAKRAEQRAAELGVMVASLRESIAALQNVAKKATFTFGTVAEGGTKAIISRTGKTVDVPAGKRVRLHHPPEARGGDIYMHAFVVDSNSNVPQEALVLFHTGEKQFRFTDFSDVC